jgi:hypothetical protein
VQASAAFVVCVAAAGEVAAALAVAIDVTRGVALGAFAAEPAQAVTKVSAKAKSAIRMPDIMRATPLRAG